MSIPQRLLTTAEAAEFVRLSQANLEKMRVYGGGPGFVRLGRAVRYRIADLEAWIAAGLVGSTSEAARAP
jgi:excisionase family DNA binding protein